MNERVSFRTIKDEIARRIGDKVWPPGTLIPGEAALADEFGAARATVNRALQELARTGLLAVSYTHLTLPTKRIV